MEQNRAQKYTLINIVNSPLIKEQKPYSGMEMVSPTMTPEQLDNHMKNTKSRQDLVLITRVNSKWIRDLNVDKRNYKTPYKTNMRKPTCLRYGDTFLSRTQKKTIHEKIP